MFEIADYVHPLIFVICHRTGETYRFLVGDDGTVLPDCTDLDQDAARRTAIAYLAQQARAA